LDKSVTVKFYRVSASAHAQGIPFLQRLVQICGVPEDQRVCQVSDTDFWMDKLTINNTAATGRLCREQTSHLPPRALPGGRLAPLGIRAIGHNSIWQYEADLSVLAIEVTRNGAGISRMFPYIRNICDCRGYAYLPVLNDAALEAAQQGRIRELAVRVATPRNLETITADQRQIKQGMVELMGSQIGSQIEIRYKAGARDPDIQPSRFLRAVRWLRGEKEADRGTISKLEARIVEDDGHYNTLDLLDAHLGVRRDLDLPDDNPDASAAIRFSNMAQAFDQNRAILQRQFAR
jgi:hypothetical protein